MSYLSQARTAIIAKAAGVAGVRSTYPRLPDVLGPTPAVVLGQASWTTIPGNRERRTYTFALDLYVKRDATDDRTIATADDLMDLIEQAYILGITLGQIGTTQCVIRGGTSNNWRTIDNVEYLVISWALHLESSLTRGYTA